MAIVENVKFVLAKVKKIVIIFIKKNAKKRNLDFQLTKEEFYNLTSKPCHYCNHFQDYNGIDRIDSTKGYYLQNCVPCCEICNKMKLDYNVEQWFEKMKQILEYSGYSITHELKNSNLTIQN